MQYIYNNLIAIDQLMNTLLGGSPDETLSSRVYRAESKGKLFGRVFRPVIDFIFYFDKEHCKTSYYSELQRKHLPPNFDMR